MRDIIDSLKYQAILAKIEMIVLLEISMVIKLLSMLRRHQVFHPYLLKFSSGIGHRMFTSGLFSLQT